MASFNRVVLMGNLTRDPQLRYLPSGMAVCEVGLAMNDRRKTPDGQWVDEATFVDITLFDRQAEIAGEYLTKGSPALIEGRLKLDRWQDKNDGQPRSKLKVVGDRVVLVGSRQGGGEGAPPPREGTPAPRRSRPEPSYNPSAPGSHDEFEPPPEPSGEGGIPF